jgi:hypothetical protein
LRPIDPPRFPEWLRNHGKNAGTCGQIVNIKNSSARVLQARIGFYGSAEEKTNTRAERDAQGCIVVRCAAVDPTLHHDLPQKNAHRLALPSLKDLFLPCRQPSSGVKRGDVPCTQRRISRVRLPIVDIPFQIHFTDEARMKKVFLPLFCIVPLLVSCLPTFTIKNVTPSLINYQADPNSGKLTLLLKDARALRDRTFTKMEAGLASFTIKYENFNDPFAYLASNLSAEFKGRGINIEVITDTLMAHDLELAVSQFEVVNRRINGYTPWETTIIFGATMPVAGTDVPIRSFFYNGKVPVWSMTEVIDPCYNASLSAIVKDIAAKINRHTFKLATAEPALSQMIAAAKEGAAAKNYQPILDLGSVNTRAAIPTLNEIAMQSKDQDACAYAFFALGSLVNGEDLAGLAGYVDNYKDEGIDLYMAIKAIGDIGTPEAVSFIGKQVNNPIYQKEIGFRGVVNLYLDK